MVPGMKLQHGFQRVLCMMSALAVLLGCFDVGATGGAEDLAPPAIATPTPKPFVAKMPPYSLPCAALLLSPLTESCGYSSGDLINMLLDKPDVVKIIPPESCGTECVDAVLGVIRSNSACKQLQDWLPGDTEDLKPLLGKGYARACADIWASKATEEGVQEAMQACKEAQDRCQLHLPPSIKQLPISEVRPYIEKYVYESWSCPSNCDSSHLSQLTSSQCTAQQLLGVSVASSSNASAIKPPSNDKRIDAASSALSDTNKGLRHVCQLTVDADGTEVTAIQFSISGLEAVSLPADKRDQAAYFQAALAESAGTLPRYVTVEVEPDGGVLSLKLKGQVLFPSAERLKIALLEGKLQNDLPGLLAEEEGSSMAANAWLEVYRKVTLEGLTQADDSIPPGALSTSAAVRGTAQALAQLLGPTLIVFVGLHAVLGNPS
mmetsp:Transcript_24233/g.67381  ORF Transcript_24233/g.67381 Transcript_24233/m.67381 type:complete len:434 (-) Transcript_24233:398-1699(-)